MEIRFRNTLLRLALWLVLYSLVISFMGTRGTAVFADPPTKSDTHVSDNQQQIPLENLLNDDGSLNLSTDFNGSLDPTGWQLAPGENGEPRFLPAEQLRLKERPAAADPSLWDDRFHPPGLSIGGCQYGAYCLASANAIVVVGTDVYVGGKFTHAGPTKVNYIAKWDGTSWSALGDGVNGIVNTIVGDGTDLYVGGQFTQAGGMAVNYIAKWDGTSWSPLGSGLSGQVNDIEIAGGKLYAGGFFTMAGGTPANNIAEWDGTNWAALGSGTNDTVRDIAIIGDTLFAGGNFTTAGAGGGTTSYIAQWDGLNWQPVGAGNASGPVVALAVSGSNLYVAIDQYYVNGGSIIDLWNGANWSSFASIEQGRVFGLLAINSDLYVVGDFSSLEGQTIFNFARWNGSGWSWAGSVGPQPYTIAYSDGNFYLGGILLYGIDNNADDWISGIVKWDGTNWHALDDGIAGGLHHIGQSQASGLALAVDDGNVYVGGDFMRAGGTAVDKLAQWNSSNWSSVGLGLEDVASGIGKVEAIAILGQDVYVGGNFTSIGGIAANSLAKWDGSQWSDLNGGVLGEDGYTSIVKELVVDGNELYVSGYFTSIGGVPANSVAKWNGSQWLAVGGGISYSLVYTLLVEEGTVYVGGNIRLDSTGDWIYIAQLIGNSWQEIGDGLNDEVYALEMHNGELVAGGRFSMSGTTPINRVARWDGQEWHPLGNGLGNGSNEKVLDLESHGELYAAGSFTTTGSEASAGLATWDGAQWESFTVAVEDPTSVFTFVNDIEFQGSAMFITGSFTEAGGQPAFNIAKWGLGEDSSKVYLPLIHH